MKNSQVKSSRKDVSEKESNTPTIVDGANKYARSDKLKKPLHSPQKQMGNLSKGCKFPFISEQGIIREAGFKNPNMERGSHIPVQRTSHTSVDNNNQVGKTARLVSEKKSSNSLKKSAVRNKKSVNTDNPDVFLQCGYEFWCDNKDCRNCPRKKTYNNLNLTLAEICVIEDFAVCDLDWFVKEKNKKEVAMMQELMFKVMHKIFYKERKGDFELKGDFKK